MGYDLTEVVLDGVPPLYSAAQNGDAHGVTVAMRRLLTRLREINPALAEQLKARLPAGSHHISTMRRMTAATPIPAPQDPETRAGLLKAVDVSGALRPILGSRQDALLEALLAEHRQADVLEKEELSPRSTLFLIGPPGVGKTTMASWLARQLERPLFQVEIPSLISSYLGRTGQNLREIFDFARDNQVVLLLDEFDAIAKRRDDQSDLGEVRRIVSVLLKEIEEWPGPGMLVAATNHSELIDPAIFRRFQLTISVELPGPEQIRQILHLHLKALRPSPQVEALAVRLLSGASGSDIRNVALESRRAVAMGPGVSVDEALLKALGMRARTTAERRHFTRTASSVLKDRVSFSALANWLGVSKATISNYLHKGGTDNG